ncbi:hypothetical protein D051_0530 [Vibrio parahaemolyticus VPCR-2010]|uniref:hypothetical protein n=1 Tax=Vibrio parahaemolyticus TaxID=670 RepID=UPI00038E6E1D|nr:hypothetical protein D051_0530 [Vibrio parahaemolyticus VPCR-2010]
MRDYELIYQGILEKDQNLIATEDIIVALYLKNILNQKIVMIKSMSKESDKEAVIDKLEGKVSELEKVALPVNVIDTIECLEKLINKNPNKLTDYDLCLSESLRERLVGLHSYLRGKCKRTSFGKRSTFAIASLKRLPYKKDFKLIFHSLKRASDIADEISMYKIWCVDGNAVNGLVIHKDRERYLSQLKKLKEDLNTNMDKVKVWVNLPNR